MLSYLKSLRNMTEYWPISLCNINCKFITKLFCTVDNKCLLLDDPPYIVIPHNLNKNLILDQVIPSNVNIILLYLILSCKYNSEVFPTTSYLLIFLFLIKKIRYKKH